MASIVPYAGYPPNAFGAFNSAVGVGKFAYRNRKAIAKAASKASKAYRMKYSKKKNDAADRARGIGVSMQGTSNKKFQALQGDPIALATRLLYLNDLTAIPKTTVADINGRERHFANVKGFSINYHLKNLTATPLHVNMAIINGRALKLPTTSGFFRDYTASRDVDFTTSLNSNELSSLPISTDRYRILCRKSFTLGPETTAAGGDNDSVPNWVVGKFYQKFNRQIRYNDDLDDEAEERIYLCYWFDRMNESAASPSITSVCSVSIRNVTYFTDESRAY